MHKLLVGLILICLALASVPTALGTIAYGGSNIESNVAVAEGDSWALNNQVGGIAFQQLQNIPMAGGIEPLVVDPTNGVYARYAHAYVYSGVDIPAGNPGSGRAEWHNFHQIPVGATANVVLPNGDQVRLRAFADGATVAAASCPTGDSTIATQAESIISAWAGGTVVPVPSVIGYAQITSRTQIDGTGQAVAGTSQRGTTGAGPVGQATATFAAERTTTQGQVPARILGNVAGTTNVESQNVDSRAPGGEQTFGYATINTLAGTELLDVGPVGARSYSKSEIRSSGWAQRVAGSGITSTTSVAVGSANSQAWDPDRDWNEAMVAGTESATSSVSGYTSTRAEALRGGDTAFGVPIAQVGLLNINRPIRPIGPAQEGQVWSQILAAAGNEMDVFGNPQATDNQRDVISLTYTSAYVDRTGDSRPDGAANAVKAYTYIGDINQGWTNPGQASARARESGMVSQTSLSNVLQSSGSHQVTQSVANPGLNPAAGFYPTASGSMAGMVARTGYNPVGVVGPIAQPVYAQLGWDNPIQGYSGLITHGPVGHTFREFDAAGSLIIAGPQDASTVSSSGTYRTSATPVRVQEWIVGNNPLNNLHIEIPTTLSRQYPAAGTALPLETGDQKGNPDFYAWRTAVGGPQ